MRKIVLLLVGILLIGTSLQAEPIVIRSTLGALENQFKPIGEHDLNITEVKITGGINAKDIYFIGKNLKSLTYLEFEVFFFDPYTGTINGVSDDATKTYPGGVIPEGVFKDLVNLQTFKYSSDNGSITEIGKSAFENCSALESFEIANTSSLNKIGEYAFANTGFRSFAIPYSATVDTIESYAFAGSIHLEKITLNRDAKVIDKYAFSNCTALTEVVFALTENLLKINDRAFENTTALSSITLPDGLTSLGKEVFYGCSNLTKVELPYSIAAIDPQSFVYGGAGAKSNISELWVHAIVPPTIDASTFDYLNKTTVALYVPEEKGDDYRNATGWNFTNINEIQTEIVNVAEAGTLADLIPEADRATLKKLVLSGTINAQDFAFLRKRLIVSGSALKILDLSRVNIAAYEGSTEAVSSSRIYPANAIPFEALRQALSSSVVLREVVLPPNITEIQDYAFWGSGTLTSVGTIPESVNNIGESAFARTNLRSIEIPGSVETLKQFTFNNCHNLQELKLNEGLKYFENNVVFSSSLKSLTLPASTIELGAGAFSSCSALETLTIKGIQKVGEGAFQNNTSLKELIFPEGLVRIYEGAFTNCHALEKVSLPKSLTKIAQDAFIISQSNEGKEKIYHNLTKLYSYAETPIKISAGTFAYFKVGVGDEDCTLYVPKGTIDAYFDAGWEFSKIVEMEYNGISDTKSNTVFTLQSNPIKDEARFLFDPADAGAQIVIRSLNGKAVINQSVAVGDTDIVIPVSHLSTGIYLAQYTDNAGKYAVLKIIK